MRAGQPAPKSTRRGILECEWSRNQEFDFSPDIDSTRYLQGCADLFRALPHTGESPVPFSAGFQHFLIDSASIIPHQDTQIPRCVVYVNYDPRGACVAKRVAHRFPRNEIRLIAN